MELGVVNYSLIAIQDPVYVDDRFLSKFFTNLVGIRRVYFLHH